ncbi:MAG: hypothetical protein HF314_11030 [Ignavibacteria bacterium]|jgi:hypothetical protein|nr:hypothetical protein [Ignavibacteria bacterium]MCU7503600.1 hypothetical protein [Ignavibacteria bacterium]MCU7516746.1 hypothetical protein [Ignavibacteria bacterium]
MLFRTLLPKNDEKYNMSLRIPTRFMVFTSMVLLLLSFSSCSSSKTGKVPAKEEGQFAREDADSSRKPDGGAKTVLKENSSTITGEIIEKKETGKNEFVLTVLVKSLTDDQAYESLLVKGETYLMVPGFLMENEEIKPVERNRKLLALGDLPIGSTFSARVSLIEGNKCIIQEVLGTNRPLEK